MEFKKSNRRPQQRPAPVMPQRSGPTRPVSPSRPEPVEAVKPKSSRLKQAFLSRMPGFLLTKKTIVIISAVVGCLLIGLLVRAFSSSTAAAKPEFQTVLPDGKSISKLGGWKRVSPPKNDPVFAYLDTIDGVTVSVSEQPLPQSFKSDPDNQVAELAKKFNATDKIDIGNTTVYVGTSAKGPQSVILTKNQLLILIKSQKKISDTSWANYAQTLN